MPCSEHRIFLDRAPGPVVASVVEAILMGPVESISFRVSRLLVEQHLIANTLEDLRRKGQLFAPKPVDPNGDVIFLCTMSLVESTPNQV